MCFDCTDFFDIATITIYRWQTIFLIRFFKQADQARKYTTRKGAESEIREYILRAGGSG